MRIRILYLFMVVSVMACDPDTSSSPEPEDVFVKFYGNLGIETAADFIVRSDVDGSPVGFLIFGTTNSEVWREGTGTDPDFFLVSTDAAGNETPGLTGSNTFTEVYDLDLNDLNGNPINVDLEASKVIQTNDGGYLMVGTALNLPDTTNNTTPRELQSVTRAFMVKVSADGTLEWNILYPGLQADNSTDKLNTEESEESVSDVIETSDGNILIIGSTTNIKVLKPDLLDPTLDPSDIWLLKFDPNGLTAGSTDLPAGNIVFERVLGFPGEDLGKAIFERSDGSLVIVGNGQGKSDGVDRDILFITADADAFNDNFQEIGSAGGSEDFINEVQLLSDDGIAVVGYTQTATGDRTMLARFNQAGGLEFFQNIQLIDEVYDTDGDDATDPLSDNIDLTGDHRGYGVTQTLSGELIVVGEIEGVDVNDGSLNNQTGRGNDILLFSTSGFGAHTEQSIVKNYGGVNADLGEAVTQIIDPDGTARFIVLSTVDFEGGSTMISLMKTSSSGNLIR